MRNVERLGRGGDFATQDSTSAGKIKKKTKLFMGSILPRLRGTEIKTQLGIP